MNITLYEFIYEKNERKDFSKKKNYYSIFKSKKIVT